MQLDARTLFYSLNDLRMQTTNNRPFDRMQIIDFIEAFRASLGPRFQRSKIQIGLSQNPDAFVRNSAPTFPLNLLECTDPQEANKAMNILKSLGYQIYYNSRFIGQYIYFFHHQED